MKSMRKLTLIDAAFVLPTLKARCDKGMMTNGLLNQDFVLQLLDVIIENYLQRGEEVTDKKMLSEVSFSSLPLIFRELSTRKLASRLSYELCKRCRKIPLRRR